MKRRLFKIRVIDVVLYTLFWMLVPGLSDAEEQPSLVQTLSYLKEKATGSWIRWDGGLFISATEYRDFRTVVGSSPRPHRHAKRARPSLQLSLFLDRRTLKDRPRIKAGLIGLPEARSVFIFLNWQVNQ
ncbi:MAG: hypothetical protein JOZ08_15205 [Verrucomicrobia bacterium]|nr:hypothetical protein [Verrucomicrobiota bacterium]MBV8278613.1 hypothetical protein [Verrucomicrobiota bacterium]